MLLASFKKSDFVRLFDTKQEEIEKLANSKVKKQKWDIV